MKTYITLILVSIGTALLLALHEYSATKDIVKTKQLFARVLCASTIVAGGMLYYISSTRSLMNEPFETASVPSQQFRY